MTIIFCMVTEIWSVTDIFLSVWTIFCPFTPLKTLKIKILKKIKKFPGDIIILHHSTKNHDHMLYWDMVHDRYNCYFSFWAIISLLPPSVPKIIIIWNTVPEIWRVTHVIIFLGFFLFFFNFSCLENEN